MEEVELLCDRAAIIDQGKIIAMDTIKNLIGLLGGGIIQMGLTRADGDILSALGALPGIKSVQEVSPTPAEEALVREGRGEASTQVRLMADHARDVLVGVIGLLNARDVDLTSLEILEPNLESVFLHLTGKSLRE